MRTSTSLLAFVGLLSLSLGGGCGGVCNTALYPDQIVLDLGQPLTAGRWEITLTAAGNTPAFGTCVVDFAAAEPTEGCRVGGQTAAVMAADFRSIGFSFKGSRPANVTVSVKENDAAPVTSSHAVDYAEAEPNGDGCGIQYKGTITR